MPQLQDHRPTTTVTLPNHPGAEIVVYGSLLFKDIDDLNINPENSDPTKAGLAAFHKFIKSWNFTDENDQPLEINKETLGILSTDDIAVISGAIQELAVTQKKS